jgi:hypothetical protein
MAAPAGWEFLTSRRRRAREQVTVGLPSCRALSAGATDGRSALVSVVTIRRDTKASTDIWESSLLDIRNTATPAAGASSAAVVDTRSDLRSMGGRRRDHSGTISGLFFGNVAIVASLTFRCWATSAGGVCVIQLESEMS